jgi:hypothetical protein
VQQPLLQGPPPPRGLLPPSLLPGPLQCCIIFCCCCFCCSLLQGNFIPVKDDDDTTKDAWLNSEEGEAAQLSSMLCCSTQQQVRLLNSAAGEGIAPPGSAGAHDLSSCLTQLPTEHLFCGGHPTLNPKPSAASSLSLADDQRLRPEIDQSPMKGQHSGCEMT